MKEDILAYVSWRDQQIPSHSRPPAFAVDQAQPLPASMTGATAAMAVDRVVPITGYTKAMVKTMTAANVS